MYVPQPESAEVLEVLTLLCISCSKVGSQRPKRYRTKAPKVLPTAIVAAAMPLLFGTALHATSEYIVPKQCIHITTGPLSCTAMRQG